MSEFPNVQRLVRLKRFERPAEDFMEDFIAQFHERQRAELLRQSAHGLLVERAWTFLGDFIAPKWTMAGATAAIAVVAAWAATSAMQPAVNDATTQLALAAQEISVAALQANAGVRSDFAVDSPLIKETETDEAPIRAVLLSRHFEDDDSPSLVGLGDAAASLLPVSADLLPIGVSELPR